ncbi:MAG TPA: hypothetical protein VK139_03270 [Microbacteriaceae bacterium]|nr:hypothetical protein [Microbacteriaceae bacterium]
MSAPTPRVTIRDIATFIPAAPIASSEPQGFGIASLPVNLITRASQHIVPGRLLGAPAEVRYTPVGVRWSISDGTVIGSRSLGASWAALGLPDFSDTETSHRFASPGRYSANPTVRYHADYRFAGGPWTSIDGTVTAPGAAITLDILAGKSALVEHTCNELRTAAGCAYRPPR